MKLLTTSVILLFSLHLFAQDFVEAKESNGIVISYKLIAQDKGDKKDKYILMVKAENKSEKDLYYPVKMVQSEGGDWSVSSTDVAFAYVNPVNATGLFSSGAEMTGNQTSSVNASNNKVFMVKAGKEYSNQISFKTKAGIEPVISADFRKSFKDISEFDLKLKDDAFTGNYTSSCGNLKMNLSMNKSEEKGEHLVQFTNGKQFVWIRQSETVFTRENTNDFTLMFNKKDFSYQYIVSDGVTCVWKKQ